MSAGTRTSAVARARPLPNEFEGYLTPQRHGEYTDVDHGVWREVLSRNEWVLGRYAERVPKAYVDGMQALDLPRHVPRVEEINERIAPTGWRTVCVDGYIPSAAYVGLMARSIFPISRNIRRPEHVDYAPAPDLVHDILGHLPLLFSSEHRTFLRRLAMVMSMAVPGELDVELYDANRSLSDRKSAPDSPASAVAEAEERVVNVQRLLETQASELTHLARMYLWSIEFGLVGAADSFQVYGAALLSAPTEFRAVCEADPVIVPYSVDVIDHDIEFSDLQRRYFVTSDFAQLHDALSDYELIMQHRQAMNRASGFREILAGGGDDA
jgi:phenylalanine-4-hydroxylase